MATAGTYNLKLHVARRPVGSSAVQLSFGRAEATGSLAVPSTGGWQSWADITRTGVQLQAGTQVMRINLLSDSFNVDWIEVSPGP